MRFSTGSAVADGLGKALLGLSQGDAVERKAYNDRMATILEQELTKAKMQESEANLGLIEGQTWNQYATADKTRAETQGIHNSQALMDPQRLLEAVALSQGTTVPNAQAALDYTRTGQMPEGISMDPQMVQALQQALAGTQLAGYASNPTAAPTTTTAVANAGGLQDALAAAITDPEQAARINAAMKGNGNNWGNGNVPGLLVNSVTGDTKYLDDVAGKNAAHAAAGRGGSASGAIPSGDIQDNFRRPVPGASPNPLTGETPTELDVGAWTDFIIFATQNNLMGDKAALTRAYSLWAQQQQAGGGAGAAALNNGKQRALAALAQAKTAEGKKAIIDYYVSQGGNPADLAGGQ